MGILGNIIKLSNEDYNTLVTTGSLTKGGVTYTYNENDIYLTPDESVAIVKVLNTNNATELTPSSSEEISGDGTINLHKIAKTGKYSDLIGTPTIPTVNNGALTLQIEGVSKATFTANQSGSVTFNVTAGDLGLSSAMKFIGVTTTAISDGSTTNPITINGASVTATSGNVVLYGNKEFVWTGNLWEELGDESSFALKTTTVTGSGALSGGGALSGNQTITHNEVLGSAQTTPGIYQITVDKYGHISGATLVSDLVHTSATVGLIKNDGTIDTTQYGTGSVKSVKLAGGTGVSVTGTNPITTSGTITITLDSRLQNIVNANTATLTEFLMLDTNGSVIAGEMYQGEASGAFTDDVYDGTMSSVS